MVAPAYKLAREQDGTWNLLVRVDARGSEYIAVCGGIPDVATAGSIMAEVFVRGVAEAQRHESKAFDAFAKLNKPS